MAQAHKLAGLRGACKTHGLDEPDDLEAELYLERVRKIAESRPSLTPEQAERLAALWGPLIRSAAADG